MHPAWCGRAWLIDPTGTLQWAQGSTRRRGHGGLEGSQLQWLSSTATSSHALQVGFEGGSELLNFSLAGLMDGSRVECELQFGMVLGAAEEPKKSERSTTSPKFTMSQQRKNNRRNEGERGRCVGQREKLHGRKTEQDYFRVVHDTVNCLFKGTFGHTTTSSRVRCPWLFGSSLSSSRSTTEMEMLHSGSIPFSRGVVLKALLFFFRTFMRKGLRMSKSSTDSKGEEGDTKVLTRGRAQARCTLNEVRWECC